MVEAALFSAGQGKEKICGAGRGKDKNLRGGARKRITRLIQKIVKSATWVLSRTKPKKISNNSKSANLPMPFLVPPKWLFWAILGVPKMAFWVPKSKFRDHFSVKNSPQNPQKATSGTKIGPRKRKNGPQKRPKRPKLFRPSAPDLYINVPKILTTFRPN